MDKDEFGSFRKLQPFGTTDAVQLTAQLGRCHSLARGLWGTTTEDLRRQLQKPRPDIPSGFDLADFQLLLRESSRITSMNLDHWWYTWMRPKLAFPEIIDVGPRRFTEWQARAEIARRAIEYLQDH